MFTRIKNYLLRKSCSCSFELKEQHLACIVYKKRVLSIGKNSLKSHPLQERFQKNSFAIYLHAEIDAIKKVKNKELLRNSTLFVVRVMKGKYFRNSEPCQGCLSAIKHYGFKNVYYSTHTGEWCSI